MLKFTSVILIGEVQKKKVYTSAGVLFRENIGEEQKRAFRHVFLTMELHFPPKNHILPLGGNLPPGWEPLTNEYKLQHLFNKKQRISKENATG